MLSKQRQKKYLRKREQEMLDRLHAYAGSREQESLHKMRVEIKKMRSFLKFVKACSGKDFASDFKPVKRIFRSAGRIRDAYNSNKMIEDYRLDLPDLRHRQDEIQHNESAVFLQHADQFVRKAGKAGKSLVGSLHDISEKCVREWIAGQLMKIAVNFMTSSMEEFHKGRKKIKNIQHVISLLPRKLATKVALNEEYLDQLQDRIGKWHDVQTAVTILRQEAGAEPESLAKLEQESKKMERESHGLAEAFYMKVFK
jgi:CHAD domain-containing protein